MDKEILKKVIVDNLSGLGENVDDGDRFYYSELSSVEKNCIADFIIKDYENEIIKSRVNKIKEILQ